MFFDRFYLMCETKGIKPNTIAKAIGVSNATATKWKNGAIPNGETLTKIADYLDCSIDYLLGRTDNPKSHIAIKVTSHDKEFEVQHNTGNMITTRIVAFGGNNSEEEISEAELLERLKAIKERKKREREDKK